MIYADFDYYVNTYMGNAIADDEFPRMAAKASRFIDYITTNRAEAQADLDAVKNCCCELAEQYQLMELAQTASREVLSGDAVDVKSESVGSWSRTYGSAADNAATITEKAQAKLAAIAYRYLTGTGLLYRGVVCKRC